MRDLPVEELEAGVLSGDRALLARAITLVESTAPADLDRARALVERLSPRSGGALRVGVTGAPGVGKSTLLEALGTRLLAEGRRLAVLAVDPTSPVSRGSILGDKTRMPGLVADPRAFVRPSPSGLAQGGVARSTREAILLLEAAGFDLVFVETVGVGQGEVAVRGVTDFFLLLVQPGSGDELQGIKRGVVELADAIAVTKADGDGLDRALRTRDDYRLAAHLLAGPAPGQGLEVLACSARSGAGVDELWRLVLDHHARALASGALEARRRRQSLEWLRSRLRDGLERWFFSREEIRRLLPELEHAVEAGRSTPEAAASRLLALLSPAGRTT
jgi:LAO/AO transport system kinase